jgi:Calcineurin-like phosphoesterase
VLAVVAVASLSAAQAASLTQSATSTPVADAYVDAGHPKNAYGTKTDLKADASPVLRTFVRFDVQGVSGTVTKATLRLYAKSASKIGFDVRDVADDSWTESVTHATAPAVSAGVTGSSGPYAAKKYVSVDVTPLVHGNGLASFAVTNTSATEVKFSSRERGAKEAPQLVVEFEPSATPPVNTSPPAISGQPSVGQTLTGDRGTWSGTQPIGYADQWLRCDTGGNGCTAIPGATATTYAPTSADLGTTLRFRVTATNAQASVEATSNATAAVTDTPPPSPVIATGGDVACNTGTAGSTTCRQLSTSNLLVGQDLAAVLPLGDLQYESGELANYNAYYGPTWGRVKAITHPVPGNHEYNTAGAAGYYGYFSGQTSSPGYYSYDIGSWHVIALNSNCAAIGGCGASSPETQWLVADLAAHPNACTLAYWHHPRFSSGSSHGSDSTFQAFWQALYDANADVVLVGHEHNYERFAPQTPSGAADPARGIREFVVGTGGKSHYGFGTPIANSQVRNADTFGVLKLTLNPGSYEWQFVPEAGKTFTDSGSTGCH